MRLLQGFILLSILFFSTNLFAQANDATRVGGYGEISYTDPDGVVHGTLDIPRFVLFLSHQFSDTWSMKSEIEVEHVRVEPSRPGGELEIEQAFADYHASKAFGLRAGLILIPSGIINQTHEPTTFNSVARPHVDQDVIPSTWRELGVGAYGDLGEYFRYQVEVTEGMNASGYSSVGIYEGKQEGALSDPTSPGLSAKIDVLPMLGIRIGASIYYQSNTAAALPLDSLGRASSVVSPLTVAALDVRVDEGNAHLRAEYAADIIGSAQELGVTLGEAIPKNVSGYYAELSYNVLGLTQLDAELSPFVRYESVMREWPAAAAIKDQSWVIAGLALRPVEGLIFKLDYEWSKEPISFSGGPTTGNAKGLLGLGIGYAF